MARTDGERWGKLSARLYLNDKVIAASDENGGAMFRWTMMITYCVDNLTDGFVSNLAARRIIGAGKNELDFLVKRNFLEVVDNGYMIHDFLDSQMSADEVDDLREKRANAGRAGGIRSGEKRAGATKTKQNEALASINHEAKRSKREANASSDSEANAKQNRSKTKQTRSSRLEVASSMNEANAKQNEADIDIDIDKDIDIDNYPLTPSFSESPTHDEVERALDLLETVWPPNRFDARTTATRFALEAAWPKITDTATSEGADDTCMWLANRADAYVHSTEERYISRFSRWLGSEGYLTKWQPQTPQAPKSQAQTGSAYNMAFVQRLMEQEAAEKETQHADQR